MHLSSAVWAREAAALAMGGVYQNYLRLVYCEVGWFYLS